MYFGVQKYRVIKKCHHLNEGIDAKTPKKKNNEKQLTWSPEKVLLPSEILNSRVDIALICLEGKKIKI